jgi:ornithine cyclodeaminase
MHKEEGLQSNNVKTLCDIVCRDCLDDLNEKQAVMFNPMGMGVFDIAIATYYLHQAENYGIGIVLEG